MIVSVDIGQSIDPTAIAVLEISTRRDMVDEHFRGPPEVSPISPSWYGEGGTLQEEWLPARIDVRHLERLPLRMNYVDQVAHVSKLLRREPLTLWTDFLLDITGVGRGPYDMFVRAGLNPKGVSITGGDGESRASWSPEEWRVSKLALVSRLQAALHSRVLRISDALPEAHTLRHELTEFRAQFTPTGYARFGAREGAHDDLVLALAIACWWASRPSNAPVVSEVIY